MDERKRQEQKKINILAAQKLHTPKNKENLSRDVTLDDRRLEDAEDDNDDDEEGDKEDEEDEEDEEEDEEDDDDDEECNDNDGEDGDSVGDVDDGEDEAFGVGQHDSVSMC